VRVVSRLHEQEFQFPKPVELAGTATFYYTNLTRLPRNFWLNSYKSSCHPDTRECPYN